MGFWDTLLDTSGVSPHGFCLSWDPGLVGLHVASDAIIGLSYFSIPLALASLVRQRGDLQYGWMIYAFVGFIIACGATHFLSIATLWLPIYTAEGLLKGVTAVLSVITATLLWPLVPRLVALRSPAQLERLNANLSDTIGEREHTLERLRVSEAKVHRANFELERRVMERTAELEAKNLELASALAARTAAQVDLCAAKRDLEGVVEDRTQALKQRDLLLREVYHRVKNNLQVIDGLVTLQALKLKDPQAKEALLGLKARIYALGLVHHQLMSSADLKTFDILPFLQELSDNLLDAAADDGIDLIVEAIPVQVGLDFAVPFGLLVTELVTNSLKYARPDRERTRIMVRLTSQTPDELVLIVSDNGRPGGGLQPDGAANSGLGMGLVSGLVSQLGGKMSVRFDGGRITEIRAPRPFHD